MAKFVLFSLPFVTVSVLIFALFVVGGPRPYFGARLHGGPTEGVAVLAWRLSAVERRNEIESPVREGAVSVELTFADGRRAAWKGGLDTLGMASPRFELDRPATGPIAVTIGSDSVRPSSLGRGSVRLAQGEWLAKARRSGGWLDGNRKGMLSVRAAPARGVFAVPFAEHLVVDVRGASGPVADAELQLDGEGLDVVGSAVGGVRTNAFGRAEVALSPREHTVSLRIRARAPDQSTGEWYSLLPVVPGALRASLAGRGKLRIESPIVRDVAYFAVISGEARLAGGAQPLAPDGRGGAMAIAELPPMPDGPLWAVVSSEAELDSSGTVGWPISRARGDDPAETLAVPDRLLLDTLSQGYERDLARRRRARWIAGAFTAGSLALVWLLMVGRARAAQAELDAHLARAGAKLEDAQLIASSRIGWSILVAALCIALGFLVAALVTIYRIG